jgi:hypothetical protein
MRFCTDKALRLMVCAAPARPVGLFALGLDIIVKETAKSCSADDDDNHPDVARLHWAHDQNPSPFSNCENRFRRA